MHRYTFKRKKKSNIRANVTCVFEQFNWNYKDTQSSMVGVLYIVTKDIPISEHQRRPDLTLLRRNKNQNPQFLTSPMKSIPVKQLPTINAALHVFIFWHHSGEIRPPASSALCLQADSYPATSPSRKHLPSSTVTTISAIFDLSSLLWCLDEGEEENEGEGLWGGGWIHRKKSLYCQIHNKFWVYLCI